MALVIATIARMGVVCLAEPITGYANNLDFFRQSACVGVWEDYTDHARPAAHVDGPVDDLVYDGDRRPDLCLLSSDNVFPAVAAQFHARHTHLELREIGALKMLVAAALIVFIVAQPSGSFLRASLAAALFLVFGDIAVLTYFNTLYVDTSGIIFATAAAALLVVLAARLRAPGWGFCVVASGCVLWLGTVKPQYAPLAVVLGLGMAFCLAARWHGRYKAALLAAAAVLGPLLLYGMNDLESGMMTTIARANEGDTLLGAVLPNATDRIGALRLLGLPPSCAPAIGQDGYGPAVQPNGACPEVAGVSRLRLLPLFIAQPQTFMQPFRVAVFASRPSYLAMQHFERPGNARRLRFRLLRATSLSNWLTWLAFPTYRWIIDAACLTGIVTTPLWAAAQLSGASAFLRRRLPDFGMMAVGGGVCGYALVSSVFGDGYGELPRHTVGVLTGVAFCAAAIVRLLADLVVLRQRGVREA